MRKLAADIAKISTLTIVAGAFATALLTSNCGGTGGMRTGAAGSSGTTGAAGTTGNAGSGGAGTPYTCPTDQLLDCNAALTLMNGHVADFSTLEWNNTAGKFCNASGLRAAIYGYKGSVAPPDGGLPSSSSASVDLDTHAFKLVMNAAPSDYAGGGLAFDHCVNASAYNAVRFSIALASGDQAVCSIKMHLKTFEQQRDDQNPPGGCPAASSCFNFPTFIITAALSATPMVMTVPFASFTSTAAVNPAPPQVVGLQWQIESGAATSDGGPQPACMVDLRIDDVDFVTQ